MNASSHDRDQELISAWLTGRLQDDDSEVLQNRLRNSVEFRSEFLAQCQLDAALREVAGQRQSEAIRVLPELAHEVDVEAVVSRWGGRREWIPALIAGIAATCLVVLLGWGLLARSAVGSLGHVATIESVQGIVSLRDGSKERFLAADSHTQMRSGMLLLDGESAAVQARLFDGSLLSIIGPAQVSLESSTTRRCIKLRNGTLTAEVRPQRRSNPLIIETPTAVVEVLGTVLSVTAGPDRTDVEVDSGKVRLERLADGATTEIASQHQCVATFNTSESLRSFPSRTESPNWRRSFVEVPPEKWKGDWIPATRERPGAMRAVPCVMGRQRNDASSTLAPIIHYGVTVRPTDTVDLGRVTENTRLRFTLFVSESTRLQMMMGLKKSDGRFGGNFELRMDSDDGELLPSGLRRFNIPLSNFTPLMPKHPRPEVGDQPYLLLITTLTNNVGMELSEIELVSQ